MYSYAVSQLLIGVYSNRYGGVRILLIGGTLFCSGMIGFSQVSNLFLLYLFRIFTGFGAGIVFIGLAKILADLFSIRFALMLGIALFIGYLGPVTGTVPVVWLIHALGWRSALLLPGLAALFFLAGIALFAKGTIKKTVPGQTFRLLPALFLAPGMLLLCVSSAIMFGIYYSLLTQIGQKSFEDVYHWSRYSASLCITLLTLVVAFNNVPVAGIYDERGLTALSSKTLFDHRLTVASDGKNAGCFFKNEFVRGKSEYVRETRMKLEAYLT